MKPKHQRLLLIMLGLASISLAVTIVLLNFSDNLVFFYSPTQLAEKNDTGTKIIRIGGLVKEGSVVSVDELTTTFIITDLSHEIQVSYQGILPNLFREGQGMVATGTLSEDHVFVASNLLAKHDETYMPPEVAEALKKSGQWKPEAMQ